MIQQLLDRLPTFAIAAAALLLFYLMFKPRKRFARTYHRRAGPSVGGFFENLFSPVRWLLWFCAVVLVLDYMPVLRNNPVKGKPGAPIGIGITANQAAVLYRQCLEEKISAEITPPYTNQPLQLADQRCVAQESTALKNCAASYATDPTGLNLQLCRVQADSDGTTCLATALSDNAENYLSGQACRMRRFGFEFREFARSIVTKVGKWVTPFSPPP